MKTGPSNIEIAAQLENIVHLSSTSCPNQEEATKKRVVVVEATAQPTNHDGGRLMSGIICINILILGCAVVSSAAFSEVITALHRRIFFIILLLLTMLWMLFYTVFSSQKNHAVSYRDQQAGPIWLRGENVCVGFRCVSF